MLFSWEFLECTPRVHPQSTLTSYRERGVICCPRKDTLATLHETTAGLDIDSEAHRSRVIYARVRIAQMPSIPTMNKLVSIKPLLLLARTSVRPWLSTLFLYRKDHRFKSFSISNRNSIGESCFVLLKSGTCLTLVLNNGVWAPGA